MSQHIEFLLDGKSSNGVKRRIRVVKSCLLCRRRRKKCDQQRPSCGTCLKKNETCEYEDNRWSVKVSEENEQHKDQSKEQGDKKISNKRHNPHFINEIINGDKTQVIMEPLTYQEQGNQNIVLDNQEEIVKFNDFPFPVPTSLMDNDYGTMTWTALTKKDIYLNIAFSTHNPDPVDLLINSNNVTNFNIAVNQNGFLKKYEQDHPELFNKSALLKRNNICFQNDQEFMNHALPYLQDHKLCWLLVEIFFETELIIHFPFVDQMEFSPRLLRLLGETGDSVNIKNTKDLATIGMLLMIMKLTDIYINFEYVPTSAIPSNDPRIQYIRENTVKFDNNDILLQIETEIISLKPSTVELFQFLLFKQYYDLYAPENCSCVKMAKSEELAILLDYARNCSLHRDPSFIGISSEVLTSFLRRLWYGLILLDNYQHLILGAPKLINDDFYDTKLPDELKTNDVEGLKSRHLGKKFEFYAKIEPMLKMITLLKSSPTIKELTDEISKLKLYLQNLKPLEELKPEITLEERMNNTYQFIHFMQIHLIFFMVYFNIYLHYSKTKKKHLSIFYFIELLKISKKLFVSITFLNLPNLHPERDIKLLFGSGLFVFPIIENCIHKFTLLLISTLSKLKAIKLLLTEDKKLPIGQIDLLDKIEFTIFKSLDNMLVTGINMSNTYFHLWANAKLNSSVLKSLASPSRDNMHDYKNTSTDLDLIIQFKRFETYDPGFSCLDEEDLTSLLQYFNDIHEISLLNSTLSSAADELKRNFVKNGGYDLQQMIFNANNSTNTTENIQLDSEALLDFESVVMTEKRWIDKMLNDFSGPSRTTDSNNNNTNDNNYSSNNGIQFPKNFGFPMAGLDSSNIERPNRWSNGNNPPF